MPAKNVPAQTHVRLWKGKRAHPLNSIGPFRVSAPIHASSLVHESNISPPLCRRFRKPACRTNQPWKRRNPAPDLNGRRDQIHHRSTHKPKQTLFLARHSPRETCTPPSPAFIVGIPCGERGAHGTRVWGIKLWFLAGARA